MYLKSLFYSWNLKRDMFKGFYQKWHRYILKIFEKKRVFKSYFSLHWVQFSLLQIKVICVILVLIYFSFLLFVLGDRLVETWVLFWKVCKTVSWCEFWIYYNLMCAFTYIHFVWSNKIQHYQKQACFSVKSLHYAYWLQIKDLFHSLQYISSSLHFAKLQTNCNLFRSRWIKDTFSLTGSRGKNSYLPWTMEWEESFRMGV